jgi:hypothetical protein
MAVVIALLSLLLPRHMVADWASGLLGVEVQVTLVTAHLAEIYNGTFAAQLRTAGWSGIAQDPLLKIAFLQAVIIASLLLIQTATSRKKLKALAGFEPWDLYRWQTLGTAYLILLENEFQYLYHGTTVRELSGQYRSTKLRMRNDVLFAPSAGTKVDAYRTICHFLEIYGHAEWETSPYVIALFGAYHSAREWASEFLHLSPNARKNAVDHGLEDYGLEEPVAAAKGDDPYWVWSGDQLIPFTSLEEARWFGRFVRQSDDPDLPEGS